MRSSATLFMVDETMVSGKSVILGLGISYGHTNNLHLPLQSSHLGFRCLYHFNSATAGEVVSMILGMIKWQ